MIQRGNRARLALEPIAESLGGELDGNVAPESGVAGAIDNAHAACPDLGRNLVGSNA